MDLAVLPATPCAWPPHLRLAAASLRAAADCAHIETDTACRVGAMHGHGFTGEV
jgi:hypothetical protein